MHGRSGAGKGNLSLLPRNATAIPFIVLHANGLSGTKVTFSFVLSAPAGYSTAGSLLALGLIQSPPRTSAGHMPATDRKNHHHHVVSTKLNQHAADLERKLHQICEKYSQDFDSIADIIDITTGEILVDNGHIIQMDDVCVEKDGWGNGGGWIKNGNNPVTPRRIKKTKVSMTPPPDRSEWTKSIAILSRQDHPDLDDSDGCESLDELSLFHNGDDGRQQHGQLTHTEKARKTRKELQAFDTRSCDALVDTTLATAQLPLSPEKADDDVSAIDADTTTSGVRPIEYATPLMQLQNRRSAERKSKRVVATKKNLFEVGRIIKPTMMQMQLRPRKPTDTKLQPQYEDQVASTILPRTRGRTLLSKSKSLQNVTRTAKQRRKRRTRMRFSKVRK